jgi:hypothetical protein
MGEVYCGVEQEKGRRGEDTKQKTQDIGWET